MGWEWWHGQTEPIEGIPSIEDFRNSKYEFSCDVCKGRITKTCYETYLDSSPSLEDIDGKRTPIVCTICICDKKAMILKSFMIDVLEWIRANCGEDANVEAIVDEYQDRLKKSGLDNQVLEENTNKTFKKLQGDK